MKRPQFFHGTEPATFTEGARDPSGFLDAGFRPEQVGRVVEFVRLCLEEYLAQSGITERAAEEFPDEVPLYCTREGGPHYGNPATHLAQTNLPHSLEEPIALARSGGVGLTIRPSFFHERQEQSRLKQALHYVFTCLATYRLLHPLNISREQAFVTGISTRMQFITPEDEVFDRKAHPVLTTSGLSVPDGFAADYRGQSLTVVSYAAMTALQEVAHAKLWELLEGMIDLRDASGHYPTSAQTDALIRESLPDRAAEILAHPAFAPAREGPQVIVFQTRAQTQALLCPFHFSRLQNASQYLDGLWNPQQYAFADRMRDPVEVSIKLLSGRGRTLGDAPVRFSCIMPFVPENILSGAPRHVRKQWITSIAE